MNSRTISGLVSLGATTLYSLQQTSASSPPGLWPQLFERATSGTLSYANSLTTVNPSFSAAYLPLLVAASALAIQGYISLPSATEKCAEECSVETLCQKLEKIELTWPQEASAPRDIERKQKYFTKEIKAAAETSDFEKIEALFAQMDKEVVPRSEYHYTPAISKATKWNRLDLARGFFERMVQEKIRPCDANYTDVIILHLNSGGLQEADALFQDMLARQIPISLIAGNRIVKAYYEKTGHNRAKEVFMACRLDVREKLERLEKEKVFDCHGLEKSVAFFVLEPFIRALKGHEKIEIIAGVGNSGPNPFFTTKEFLKSTILARCSLRKVTNGTNVGRLEVSLLRPETS